jgi:hypothetical protein
MTTINEAINSNTKPPLGAILEAGVNTLDANQTITFTLYKRIVLPLDGFIFWVNMNVAHPSVGDPPTTLNIQGALHYSVETEQEQESTISLNTVVFTALTQVDTFNQINPQFMYLANYKGIRFSFSSQGKYFQQADLYHYLGVAVTSIMSTQIIDDIDVLNSLANKLIITNSLPIWLSFATYMPDYTGGPICPIKNIFPSFLVPDNQPPPYAAIHIEESKALQAFPLISGTSMSSQLVCDTVEVTTYGVANNDMIGFLNFVVQYSMEVGLFGIMNMPIILDEKHAQAELSAIAQKKTIEFKISYLQTLSSDPGLTRQLIKHALVDIDVWDTANTVGNKRAHVAPQDKVCIQGASSPLP